MPRWKTELGKGMALVNGTEVNADVVRQCVVLDAIVAAEDHDTAGEPEEVEYWGLTGQHPSVAANCVTLPRQITLTRHMLDRLAILVDPDFDPPFKSKRDIDKEAAAYV